MSAEKQDIRSTEDIKLLVDSFYEEVKKDALLGPVFYKVIGNDWTAHMQILYNFWNTLLLSTDDYKGNPFVKHVKLPIKKEHFQRWLELFFATLDDLFTGPKAEEAKQRANSIAIIFQTKMGYPDLYMGNLK